MGGMPLFPETKMADARKYSVSGNHWPGEPRDQCLKVRPHLNFAPRSVFWSRIFYKYFVFKHTLSSLTSRHNTITLSYSLIAVKRHKMYKPLFSTLYLVGETFYCLKNSNCVEPQKETNI